MFIGYSGGCLLPLFIILNLFFGRLLFSTNQWLVIGGVLVLVFLLNSYITARRVFSSGRNKRSNVIDVEGRVIKDK